MLYSMNEVKEGYIELNPNQLAFIVFGQLDLYRELYLSAITEDDRRNYAEQMVEILSLLAKGG